MPVSYYNVRTLNSYYDTSTSNTLCCTATLNSTDAFETAPEQVPAYIKVLREKRLLLSLSEEVNWSGKGQHVEFEKSDKLPLIVKPSAIGQGRTAVVDAVL